MKVHNLVKSSILAAALVVSGALAVAQPGSGGPGGLGPGFGEHRPPMERMLGPRGAHGRWWNDPDVIQKLNLNDDQRKAMDDILQKHREKLIDLHASVDKTELAMQPLLSEDQPNESAVLAQIDKIAQARAELEKANARFLLALRAKLTPDQWKQLQTMREDRHPQGPDGRPMRHRGSPDGAPGAPSTPPPGGPGPQNSVDE
ncbi:MAG TPA: Spy/CpxP family protein refolding chaperone [Terracidiphilus sp.]